MDITDSSPQRQHVGVELLASGEDSLTYEGIVFWKDREGVLVVESFSEFVHPEGASLGEAQQKIARSKEIVAQLSSRITEFQRIAESMPHRYEFCHSYGKSAVKLAWLKGSEVVWCG